VTFRSFVAVSTTATMSFSPVGLFFIHTFLVGELIRSWEEGRAKRMRISIYDGRRLLRGSQICFSMVRIYSNLQRLGIPHFRKKKRSPRAMLLFLLSFFCFFLQKERKLASAFFGPFYTLVDRTISCNAREKKFNHEFIIQVLSVKMLCTNLFIWVLS